MHKALLLALLGLTMGCPERALKVPETPILHPTNPTVGTRCIQLWMAICERWASCGVALEGDSPDCLTHHFNSCCIADHCESPEVADPAQVTRCETDVNATTCDAVDGEQGPGASIPASCMYLLYEPI